MAIHPTTGKYVISGRLGIMVKEAIPGVDVKAGDLILQINGKQITCMKDWTDTFDRDRSQPCTLLRYRHSDKSAVIVTVPGVVV